MNDNELDEALNKWRTPAPSNALRARVLEQFPRRERRSFARPLRWGLAMAAAMCLLAIGGAQSGGGLGNLGDGLMRLHNDAFNFVGDLWVGHVMTAFRNSNPKIYVDGELRADAEFGGSGIGLWLRVPEDGKYFIGMRRTAFEGPVPPRSGRFDGRTLEFQSGARAVRIEAAETFGFERLPVYVLGPRADR
jgi:hypothetical protein